MSKPKAEPLRSESAEMAVAMVLVRARACTRPGRWFSEPAGYQRKIAWKIEPDGVEMVGVHREHLIPWRMDVEAVYKHLPPGLQVADMEGYPERRALYFTLHAVPDAP